MCNKADSDLLDTIVEIVSDIRHDIVMENYRDAKEKILLLGDLLKTLNEGNYRK